MKKYDHQLILGLTTDSGDRFLQQKLVRNGEGQVSLLKISDSQQDKTIKEECQKLTHQSRLYICAHGSDDSNPEISNKLYGDNNIAWDINKIVSYLSEKLAHLKNNNNPSTQRLRISLVVCFAAKPQNNNYLDSLAAKIHRGLGDEGIYVDINAVVTIRSLPLHGYKVTTILGAEEKYKENNKQLKLAFKQKKKNNVSSLLEERNKLFISKQPNSKITYTWSQSDNNSPIQCAYDSYELKVQRLQQQQFTHYIDELHTYAKYRPGTENANIANELANNLTSTSEFLNPTSQKLSEFKKNGGENIAAAKEKLIEKKCNDPLLMRIIDKINSFIDTISSAFTSKKKKDDAPKYSCRFFCTPRPINSLIAEIETKISNVKSIEPKQ